MDGVTSDSYCKRNQSISSDEECGKTLLNKDKHYEDEFSKKPRYPIWQLSILSTTTIILLMSTSFLLYKVVQNQDLDRICSSYTEQYRKSNVLRMMAGHKLNISASPVLDALDITYDTVQFNGSFSKETIYRKLAGTGYEVDQAWIALGVDCKSLMQKDSYELEDDQNTVDHPISIAAERGVKYGLNIGQVKLDKESGGGFVAYVEVMHHLHCLVRRILRCPAELAKSTCRTYFDKLHIGIILTTKNMDWVPSRTANL
jgi:hypothetical protein